jgi:hypothetical protein
LWDCVSVILIVALIGLVLVVPFLLLALWSTKLESEKPGLTTVVVCLALLIIVTVTAVATIGSNANGTFGLVATKVSSAGGAGPVQRPGTFASVSQEIGGSGGFKKESRAPTAQSPVDAGKGVSTVARKDKAAPESATRVPKTATPKAHDGIPPPEGPVVSESVRARYLEIQRLQREHAAADNRSTEPADRPIGDDEHASAPQGNIYPPLVVREYAHKRTAAKVEARTDFTETLYWHPVLVLPSGQARVGFDLCDSITSFQVLAAGHTLDGRLGAATVILESRLPFSVEPKLPIEVTASDRIDIPVTIANDTAAQRSVRLQVRPGNLKLLRGPAEEALLLEPNQRTRRLYRFQPSIVAGNAHLLIDGYCEPFAADRVLRSFKVVPEGFPVTGAHSDVLRQVANLEVPLPETWFKGTLECHVHLYPTILGDLQTGLDAMLCEPFG